MNTNKLIALVTAACVAGPTLAGGGIESPRVLRRLLNLRRWSHEKIKPLFPRDTRMRSSPSARTPRRVSVAVVGY